MRLRGLVFEQFATFDRAEVSLCDASGSPLDVVLFVGESGSGKTALLRGIASVLAEAALAGVELDASDVRRGATSARCRIVFEEALGGESQIVAVEKELAADPSPSQLPLRSPRSDVLEGWRRAIARDPAPRAAFSIASPIGHADGPPSGRPGDQGDQSAQGDDGADPLVDWLFRIRGTEGWPAAIAALDHVLWPHSLEQVTPDGELVFTGPSGIVSSSELGDGFESVMVLALELLRMSTELPNELLVYVIDDIDAHLPPRWQSRIIGDLRRAFPRVQLVASTHSPLVVASVEPHQVFRIEAEAHDSAAKIVRAADRVRSNARGVAMVMDLAFGAADLPGPRWALAPSIEIRREVLAMLEPDLARGAVVYVLPEPVFSSDVKNSFGEPCLPGPGASGTMFFVDYRPGTPWSHPCVYVFRANDGRLRRDPGMWPPENLDRFVPIGGG